MPRRSRRLLKIVCAMLALCAVVPRPAAAQGTSAEDGVWEAPSWVGDVTFLGANAILAGVTAGIRQALSGGSFEEGFTKGAFGGAIAYGGRRLAVRDFAGAGFLGRQLSAVGISIASNAADGVPVLSRFTLPVGPVSVDLRRDDGLSAGVRVDANATAALLGAVMDERLEWDARASLSAGAPVFRAPRHIPAGSTGNGALGIARAGTVVLGRDAENVPGTAVLAHERVHVLQYDFLQALWGDPLEMWFGARLPFGETVLRFVRPGVIAPTLHEAVSSAIDLDWRDRPWEIEASFLEHR